MKLQGKIAIVTGTSPNIGGGIAQGLADEGPTVVCVDVVPENAEQCADWIKGRGGTALRPTCDVTDQAQGGARGARVRVTFDRLRPLRHNPGLPRGLGGL